MYYFVVFKASWCGHCQHFQETALPLIKKYIDEHKNFVNLIIYDADTDSDVMNANKIEGYPTIRLYGGNKSNPLQKEIIEFQNRDPEHIKRVLNGFEKKVGGKKVEHFTPTKSVSYSSYYSNYNGKEKKVENGMICENGVCKRKTRTIDQNGQIQEQKDIVPYNDYDAMRTFYDVSLDIRNHF